MRNVLSPYLSLWESELQGKPIGVRVEDVGKSESLAVMAGIGVAFRDNITPRESGQTSDRCWMTKKLEQLVTRCSVDMGVGKTHWRGLASLIWMTSPTSQYRQGFVLC